METAAAYICRPTAGGILPSRVNDLIRPLTGWSIHHGVYTTMLMRKCVGGNDVCYVWPDTPYLLGNLFIYECGGMNKL